MSQWMQCNFIQTDPQWADSTCSIQPHNSGGYGSYGGGARVGRRRPPEELRKQREELGIIPPEAQDAIAEVAARQAERLELDAQKQYDELRGELLLRNIQIETRHLEELAAIRERLIREEIASRLRMRLDMDALWMLVQIAAAC